MKKKILSILLATLLITSTVSVQAANLKRLGGANRFETAELINNKMTSKTLILASAFSFADALSATPLVHYHDGEIHLAGNALDDNTIASLERGEFSKAIIVGGTGVINTNIELQLDKYLGSSNVTRLGGINRYDTSNKVVDHINKLTPTVPYTFIVAGLNFADALSVAPVAAMTGSPIILSDGKTLISNGISATKRTSDTVYKIGGPTIVGNNFDNFIGDYERLYGKDRFETNQKVISEFKHLFTGDDVFVASGFDYPDALAGSALAAQEKAPIVFTGLNSHYQNAKNTVKGLNKENLTALGGTGVISRNVMLELNKQTSTPQVAPTITVGNNTVTIEQGGTVTPASFGISVSGDIATKGFVGNYDVNTPGTYNFKYTATGTNGLSSSVNLTLVVNKKVPTETMFTSVQTAGFKAIANDLMLQLVNAERAIVGVKPVVIEQPLVGLSQRWCDFMIERGEMAHSFDGKMSYQWFTGYLGGQSHLGENLATISLPNNAYSMTEKEVAEYITRDVFTRWKNSGGHYGLLIDNWSGSMGLGFSTVSNGAGYATLTFN